jgi:hypothetical protein
MSAAQRMASEPSLPGNVKRDGSAGPLPRGLLIGAGGLVGMTLTLVIVARLTGYQPATPPPSTIVQSQALRFEDHSDGGVAIYTSPDDKLVDTLPPGSGGSHRHRSAVAPHALGRWPSVAR